MFQLSSTHKKRLFDPNYEELQPKSLSQSVSSPMSLSAGAQEVPQMEQKRAAWWPCPTKQYSSFQKLLPKKAEKAKKEKALPIITSEHIDLE